LEIKLFLVLKTDIFISKTFRNFAR